MFAKYKVSLTNKIHIIDNDHFDFYIKRNNKSIGFHIEEGIESAHAAMNKRLTRSNYWGKDIYSEKHGENIYKCIMHLNSYNI